MSKQKHPIDDLFRRELADYKVVPDQERRAAFLEEAGKEIPKRRWPGFWITGMITAVLIIGGLSTGILLYNQQDHPATTENTAGIKKNVNNNLQATDRPAKNVAEAKKTDQQDVRSQDKSLQVKTNTEKKRTVYASIAQPQPKAEETKETNIPGLKENPDQKTIQQENSVKPAPVPERIKNPAETKPVNQAEQVTTEKNPTPIPAEPPVSITETKHPPEQNTVTGDRPKEKKIAHKEKAHLQKQWSIELGVHYTPEWMFNTLNGDKFVNNAGIEGTFHFGPYSVRTGVGLSITNGSNQVLVEANPYLGSYNALDSIAFNWDDNHYYLIPTYYTKSQDVFDTLLQYNYSWYRKRYTYLQVPLILGYDFWKNRWLSLGVRGGAVMSVLLNTEVLSQSYDPGKDKIITVNNITPDRIQLNWQALAGINASFRISRRFSLDLEPELRYYFNSVYESSELTKKLWSVGIRAAILIKY